MTEEEASWRPSDGEWSLIEILAHLADEEREDFRERIDITLNRPEEDWPPIDPSGWVTERHYSHRSLSETWASFEHERRRSIVWLAELGEPDWGVERIHPLAGPLRVGDLMLSWVAHDLLHLRQFAHRRHQYISAEWGGFSPEYAGEW